MRFSGWLTAMGIAFLSHFFAPPDCGAEPKLGDGPAISLPAEVHGEPVTFIRINAETKGEIVRWYPLDPAIQIFPVELQRDSKTAVIIVAQPGRYRLIAWTAIGGDPSKAAQTTIVVGNAPAPPTPVPPGPGPTPPGPTPPGPTPPAPDSELSRSVAEWAKGFSPEVRRKVAAATRKVCGEDHPTIEAFEARMVAANREAIGAARFDWLPFFQKVQVVIQERKERGLLISVDQYKSLALEIAAGLEK